MRTVSRMRMGLAVSMVAGSCLMAALPGTALAGPVELGDSMTKSKANPALSVELSVIELMQGDFTKLIPDGSATPDGGDDDAPGDATETVPGDGSSDDTPTVPGDDSSSTPQSNDDTPTIPGDDETPTVPGDEPWDEPGDEPTDEPGDNPGSETDEPGTRTRLPFTGGDALPYMAIGLTMALAGTGFFLRNLGRAAEASFRDDTETSS